MDKIDHGIGFLALDWLQWGEKWDEQRAEIALKYMSQLRDELSRSIVQMDEMAKRYAAENSKLRLDLDIAVEALEHFQLGHTHTEEDAHYRRLGETYGWCSICSEKVELNEDRAKEALAKIRGTK